MTTVVGPPDPPDTPSISAPHLSTMDPESGAAAVAEVAITTMASSNAAPATMPFTAAVSPGARPAIERASCRAHGHLTMVRWQSFIRRQHCQRRDPA
jgi:hypothetical protein